MMDSKRAVALTSGQLGAAAGVSADTIRHYEKLGLLAKPMRTDGGYRLYPSSALLRVQTIRSALKAGFGLTELTGIFRERDTGGAPCRRVANMASDKIKALDRQIAELTELRDWLSATVAEWNARLERTLSGKRAGLLESLAFQDLPANRQSKGSNHETNLSHVSSRLRPRRIRPDTHELPHARSARDI
ncbi:MAG: heavy metal-responsive transcriptional regulator [Terracidiphilus sp.]|jgi:DNA-binding transcriptional MerR regulator